MVYAPCDSNLIQAGKDILNTFETYVGTGWVTGQNENNWTIPTINDNSNLVNTYTGKFPSIRGFDLDPWRYTNPDDLQYMINTWNSRYAIVNISFHAAPWGDTWATLDDSINVPLYLQSGTPENTSLMAMLDDMADGLQVLETAGVPVLWRPYHEAGAGWWWSNSGGTQYKNLWTHMWNYYTNTRGLHNLIWVWSTNGVDGASKTAYYPGDQYCDIIGGSFYNDGRTPAGNWSVLNACSSTKMKAVTEEYCCGDVRAHIWSWNPSYPYVYFLAWDPPRSSEATAFSNVYNASSAITYEPTTQRSVTSSADVAVVGRRSVTSSADVAVVGRRTVTASADVYAAAVADRTITADADVVVGTTAPVLAAYDAPTRASVPSLAGDAGLATLMLRIRDHSRHIFEWAREKRPDIGVLYPSFIGTRGERQNAEFTVYEMLKFTHAGAGLTEQGNVNEVCDGHQVHPHNGQWRVPNPWTGSVPAAATFSAYHYWKACEEVRAWRQAIGLPDNTRPLLATEAGIDYAFSGTGRTDLFQLRRLKYGMLALGCLYYGCSLINLYAIGRSTSSGFNLIDTSGTVPQTISLVGAGAVYSSAAMSVLTPELPTAVIEPGDLLVCVSYSRTSTGTHSSSWTTHTTLDTGPHFLMVSYKIAAGSGIDAPPTITPVGVAVDQTNIACVLAFRGIDQTTPFGTPGANSNNVAAEDIGPIAAATPLVTDGAAIVIGVRNANSTGNIASVLSGDGLTWAELADGGTTTNFGCHMAVDWATWTDTVPTLTAKTFDIATGLTGAACGKMILLRPGMLSGGSYYGSLGERDIDYAIASLDMREANDSIPFTAKPWQDYWRDWQVAFDQNQDPIDGGPTVCPFAEWNRVTMAGGTVTMTAGGRNVLARKKNLRKGTHTFSCDIQLTGAGSQACLRVSGHDKLNGLNLVSSNVLIGPVTWTRLSVSFTPRQHNNPRLPDPRYAVIMVDHNGTGTCEVRSPSVSLGGSEVVPPPPPQFYDLVVTDITWTPLSPVAGEAVTFSANIFNNGNAPTPSGIIHGVRFDVDGAVKSWSDNVTASLDAHAQRVQTANSGPGGVSTWTAVAGAHSVQAYVDDVNRIPGESDNANNQLVTNITVAEAPTGGITPPVAASAAGLTELFFNDEFNTISLYHPVTNPSGTWRTNEWYMDNDSAGYVAFGNDRCFMVNQTTTNATIAATMQPYFPLSLPEPSVLRITVRRARNNAGTWLLSSAMNTLTNNIAVAQDPALNGMVRWISTQITTSHFFGDTARDYFRPAYIEGRIRWTPVTNGIGCGFWQYAASTNTTAKSQLEIDTLETNNLVPTNFNTNIHEFQETGVQASVEHARTWGDGNWHIIALHWDQSFLRIYWENQLLYTFSAAQASVFSEPMRMMIGITGPPAYADGFTGLIPADSVTEMRMDLDWVRVWRPGASNITVYPATGTLASGYTVTAGGQNSPVYPVTINTWFRNNPNTPAPGDEAQRRATMEASNETAGFTAFDISGTAAAPVAVRFNDRTVTSAKVYPVRHGITPTISGGNTVNFSVNKPGKYIVMINNTEVRPCHVFVHPKDTTAPIASGPGVVYYGPGTHNVGTITVVNNTTYYIAGGARVIGNFNCADRTGFTIKGRGVVQSLGNFLVGDGASSFTVEGVTVLRPLGTTSDWTFKQRNSTNFTIDGVNVFSCEVTRDGIDSVSCRDYTIKNSFARTLDDPCSINAAFSGLGNIANATIEDCVFMPDTGIGGLEMGASFECATVTNVTYRRIDLVNPRIQCAISILNSDYADINGVVYDDIHIDGFRGSVATSECFLARFGVHETSFSGPYTPPQVYQPGRIRNVDLYNVTTVNTQSTVRKFRYRGNSTYSVGPIRWHNLRVDGVLVTSASQVTVDNVEFVGSVTYDTETSALASLPLRGLTMNMDSTMAAGAYWTAAIDAMNTFGVDYTREATQNLGTFAAGSTTFSPFATPWLDSLRSVMTAANKRVILPLVFGAADNGNPDNYGPLHRQRIASFSTWVAQRYGDWALWFLGRNEPEIQTNWVNLSVDDCANRIVAEQKAAYDAVKAVNPAFIVEGPPMVTHPYNYTNPATAFERSARISYRILELGITRYMDAFGFHSSTGATEDLTANNVLRPTYQGHFWTAQRATCGPNGWPFVPAHNTEWNSPSLNKPAIYTAMTAEQWQAEVHHLKLIMHLFVGVQHNAQYAFARSAAGIEFNLAQADGITPREPVFSRTRDYLRYDKYELGNFTGRFNTQIALNGWQWSYPWMVVWEVLNPVTAAVNGLPIQWSRVTWNLTGGTALGYSTNDYAAVANGGATMLRQPVTRLNTTGRSYTVSARVKLQAAGTARLRCAGHVRLPIAVNSEFADATTTTVGSIVTLSVVITPTNPWTVISLETFGGGAHWFGVTIA